MSLDLNKLENKLDEALNNETSETLSKFLNDKRMTNNKQQTEINAVEYLGKVNQFAKENNTDKPRQQTVVEWIKYQVKQQGITHYFSLREILEYAEEIEKQQHIKSWEAGLMKVDFNEYYDETYGGGNK